MNVTEPIRRTARLTPDAIAIVTADHGTMSYAALDRGIDRMAIHASGLGLRAGDVAGLSILPPHEAPALILALGLARIGVATAEPSLGDDLMRLCFQATGPGRPAGPAWSGSMHPGWTMPRRSATDPSCRSTRTGTCRFGYVPHPARPGGRSTSLSRMIWSGAASIGSGWRLARGR